MFREVDLAPDRSEIGRRPHDELRRQRLIDLLARRWEVPVVVVEASGGFGKTTAVAQAILDNDEDPSGIDFYLRCRASMSDPTTFLAEVLSVLGRGRDDAPPASVDLDGAVAAVAERLAAFSPDAVTFHLDEAHRLVDSGDGECSAGASLIGRLVSALPGNAHLALIGRPPEGQTLAEALGLAPSSVPLIVRTEDLVFTGPELERFASRHGVDVEQLRVLGGWPAVTRLAVAAGTAARVEFLLDEIITRMPAAVREALAAVAMAGVADAEVLQAAGIAMSAEELAAAVPLVDDLGDGRVRAHDLWSEVIEHLVDSERRQSLAQVIAPWHSESARHDEAIRIAAAAGAWDVARRAVMDSSRFGDTRLNSSLTRGWLGLFPPDQDDEPEIRFLRGLTARIGEGRRGEGAEVGRALEVFIQRGDLDSAAVAAVEVGVQAWLAGDQGALAKLLGMTPLFRAAGNLGIEALASLGQALLSEIRGEFLAALRSTEELDLKTVPVPFVEVILRHRATMWILLGQGDEAVAEIERLVDLLDTVRNRFILGVTLFQNNQPQSILESWVDRRYPTVGNRRDDYWMAVFSCMIDASLGVEPRCDPVLGHSRDRAREKAFAALVGAASAVIGGDERAAAELLDELVDEVGFDNPLAEGELVRFLPYGYLLSERIRTHIDNQAEEGRLGPLQARRLDLARLLFEFRRGGDPEWDRCPDPAEVFCSLPLPWSVQLAAGLTEQSPGRGVELTEYLLTVAGPVVRNLLRDMVNSDTGPGFSGAGALLSSMPVPPAEPTRVQTMGEVVVERSGHRVRISRMRVRQILELLVLRPDLDRATIREMLWPAMDTDRGGANLRISLNYLREYLEPDRRSGEPTFHLRQEGDHLRLHRSSRLQVDAWEIESALDRSARLKRQGRLREAMELAHSGVELWQGTPFADLYDVPELLPDVVGFRSRCLEAGVEVAEWLLSEGRSEDAIDLARRILDQDPYEVRVRGVVIAAHLDEGRLDQAAEAIGEALEVLEELDSEPDRSLRMLIRRYRLRTVARTA